MALSVAQARLVVVGSGLAGLSCAAWGARLGLDTLVVAGAPAGGVLSQAHIVEGLPGVADGLGGAELTALAQKQAEAAGARFLQAAASGVRLAATPFVVSTDAGEVSADAVVLALGARPRTLGVPGEAELAGYGVSSCATCDGFFCQGREVLVVGGGDAALTEALYLCEHASRVRLAFRGAAPRAQATLLARAQAEAKIELMPWREVVAIHGERGAAGVEGATLRDRRSGETQRVPAAGVFIAVGREPETALLRGQVALDEAGYVVRAAGWDAATATSVAGVFAAGECADRRYRQAVTAAAMGCMAAMDAAAWLSPGRKGP